MGDESIPGDSPGSLQGSHFKAIFDHAPIGIGLVDSRGRTLVSNPLLHELTGFSAEELRDLDFNTITHRDDIEPNATLFRELMEGRRLRFSVDKRIYRRDGLPIWVRVTVAALSDEGGGPRYALGMMEDITERRRQDERYGALLGKLTQAQALFESAFRNAGLGMDLTDDEGRFLQVNTALCQMVGYSEEELLGMRRQDITHPDDLSESERRLQRTFAGSDVVEFVKRYVHRSGRVLWCKLNSSLVHGEDGRPLYAVSQIQDITRQREMEHALGHAQKMEAIGRLAGGVAHDFNNLLLVINNYAQMLRDDMGENDPRRADLDEIVEAGARATRLVQQLLAFSRQDAPRPQALSVNEAIQDLLALLTRSLGEDIEIQVDLAPDLWATRIDLSQMEQVLVNLADNARGAMPSGGTLLFRTGNLVVEGGDRTDLRPGRYVQLEVSDSGEGIDPAILPKLFEPFFTTKPRGEGAGLGLATVYGIVDRAGGAVEVSSKMGAGARFRILLPAGEEGDSPS
ncbi:MAG: PAS domain S-box protein [Actinomycetota bacterium]